MAKPLVIKINGDVKNYKKAIEDVEKETKDLSDSISSVAKGATIAFAGLTASVFGSVSAFRTQEQAEIRTAQTLKATGFAAGITKQEIFDMASALQEVSTFGDEAIISGQNLLLTFRNIGKDVFPEVTEIMLDMSEAMGQDLQSSAIQLGKALNDPITGMTALTRVGITFTEEQKNQIKTLQESGDMMGAQKVILKELENQFGGVARASANGTGAFIQLSNTAGDLVEMVGKALAPTLIKASKALNSFLKTLKENEELTKTVATLLAVGTAVTGLTAGLGIAAGAFLKLRAVMAATLPIIKGISISFKGLVGATGIGLLAILITDLAINWEKRLNQMQNVFEVFSKNISSIGSGLGNLLEGIATFDTDQIKQGFNEVKNIAIKSFDEISKKNEEFNSKQKSLLDQNVVDNREAEMQKIADNQAAIEKKRQLSEQESENRSLEIQDKLEQFKNAQALETEAELESLIERQEFINEQKEIDRIQELERQGKHAEALAEIEKLKNEKIIQSSKEKFQREKQLQEASLQAAQNFLQAGAQLSKQGSQEQKNLQTVSAIISTYTGINRALASAPPPANFALAASVGALGFANVRRIQGANFQDGGIFRGGIPGVDSIPAVVQQGEIIAPTRSFDEVVEGVARQRGFVPGEDSSGAGGGVVTVVLEPKGDLVDFIEQKIVEARVQNTNIL